MVVDIRRGDLVGRHVELLQELHARQIERGGEHRDPELRGVCHQLGVFEGVELQRLAMLAVGPAEAVLAVVGLVEERPRIQRAVVALLQLDRIGSRLGRGPEHRLAGLHGPLVADLGDYITVADVIDRAIADLKRSREMIGHLLPSPLACWDGRATTPSPCQNLGSNPDIRTPILFLGRLPARRLAELRQSSGYCASVGKKPDADRPVSEFQR